MTSRIYVYPRIGSAVVKVDIAHLTDLQISPVKISGHSLTVSGGGASTVDGGYDRVRIVVERRSERLAAVADYRDQMRGIADLLQRGGRIGFALDTTKAAYSRVMTSNPAGLSIIATTGSLTTSWEASGAVAAGDRVVLASDVPARAREEHTIDSVTGTGPITTVLNRAVWFDHDSPPLTLRHYGFYPALRLDPDAAQESLVLSERGYVFTASFPLVEDLDGLREIVTTAGDSLRAGAYSERWEGQRSAASRGSRFGDL